MNKKKSLLTIATLASITLVGAIVISNTQNLEYKQLISDTEDVVSGSIVFSRATGTYNSISETSGSISGDSLRGNKYYAVSHNASDISLTPYIARFSSSASAESQYVSFSSTSSGSNDLHFQYITGIKVVTASESEQNLFAYYSSDGLDFSSYEIIKGSNEPSLHVFNSPRQYLRIGEYLESNIDITSIELFYSCSASGAEIASKSMFNEINDKMAEVTEIFGSVYAQNEAEEPEELEPSPLRNNKVTKGEYDNEDTMIAYGVRSPANFFNVQQQLNYIVYILNYIHEYLDNSAYGVDFAYGVTFEGEGFMETITGLNAPIKQYNMPTPKLKVRFEQDGNDLWIYTSWDYRYPALGYYSLDILSTTRFVFSNEGELEEIWVNYFFADSVWFNMATGLFDFVNQTYWAILQCNSSERGVEYPDGKEEILENIATYKSGAADCDHLINCNSISVCCAPLNIETFSSNLGYERWDNRIFDDEHEYIYDEDKPQFNALYTTVYNKLRTFPFITEFTYDEKIEVENLVDDAAEFAFWKSIFVYNQSKQEVVMPYMEYEELLSCLVELRPQVDASVREELDHLIELVLARKDKYVGNKFSDGESVYMFDIADLASPLSNNEIAYECENGFGLSLLKDDTELLKFTMRNSHPIVYKTSSNNIIPGDDAVLNQSISLWHCYGQSSVESYFLRNNYSYFNNHNSGIYKMGITKLAGSQSDGISYLKMHINAGRTPDIYFAPTEIIEQIKADSFFDGMYFDLANDFASRDDIGYDGDLEFYVKTNEVETHAMGLIFKVNNGYASRGAWLYYRQLVSFEIYL